MTSTFLIFPFVLLSHLGLAQSNSENEMHSPSCSNHALVEEDDFGRGTLIKTKAIRVGDGLWVSSSKVGTEKKLIVSLVFSGTSDMEINPDDIHLFSLDSSTEKLILEMTPAEIKKPVSQTQSTGGTEYLPIDISTTTTYQLSYELTDEAYDLFLTHPLSSIKIDSLSPDFPIRADRKGKLKLFRDTLACIR